MATKKATTPGLDPKVADKLLDKLGTDNDFRRLFKKDPAAALVKVGHPKDSAAMAGGCCQVKSIAPKAQIIGSRDTLKTMLTSALGQNPPMLEAAANASRRLRK
jgi:putative modified peptide